MMEKVNELQAVQSFSIIDSIDLSAIQNTMVKIASLQKVVQSTLKQDHDYGVIPGTGKPTLLKPGAEKILMMFGLTSEYEFLDKTENYEKGFFAYTLRCILTRNGQKITEGVGQCNTMEGKYRFRWVTEKNIPEGIEKETLISRTKEGKYGQYNEYKIENDDPYTLANTVLKMAKKRAQIDAVLTVGSLSEIFTQDMEDLKEFIQQEQVETMQTHDAKNIKVTFGKHKGKTLGEIVETDTDYLEWLSANGKDAVMRKACTELLMARAQTATTKDNNKPTKQNPEPETLQQVDEDDIPEILR